MPCDLHEIYRYHETKLSTSISVRYLKPENCCKHIFIDYPCNRLEKFGKKLFPQRFLPEMKVSQN